MTLNFYTKNVNFSGNNGSGGGGGSVDVDNVTIKKNSSDQIYAVGLKQKNTSSSISVYYDWIGTLDQYNAGVASGTILPSWKCFITDDTIETGGSNILVVTISSGDSISLANNTIYNGAEISTLTISLPSSTDNTFISEIDFSSGSTPTTFTYPNTIIWSGDDVSSNVFTPVASKRYVVMITYDGVNFRGLVKGV